MLSGLVHLSEGYFCNVFKETMGMTATEYINGLRVKRAADLLTATDMSVTEAALCSGFSDLNYFSRVFKKQMGVTPNSVRHWRVKQKAVFRGKFPAILR